MKLWRLRQLACVAIAATLPALAQDGALNSHKPVQAGSAFSIRTSGSGSATLYIIGLGRVLERTVQLGEPANFAAGSLSDAGHYLLVLKGSSGTGTSSLEVTPATTPKRLSFLAKPSRLPVSLHDGITGAAYVYDSYGNLILTPMTVSFQLSGPAGVIQKNDAQTRNGAAWTEMDTTNKQGVDRFVAEAGETSSARIIQQVPGDPCGLKMSAQQSGDQLLQLKTDPILDCSGNPVLDGTIVTFTEAYNGDQSMADVPLKHGIAEVTMPAHRGATLSVASGVVLGNQIRWEQ